MHNLDLDFDPQGEIELTNTPRRPRPQQDQYASRGNRGAIKSARAGRPSRNSVVDAGLRQF